MPYTCKSNGSADFGLAASFVLNFWRFRFKER
jgi:hypothetical protein